MRKERNRIFYLHFADLKASIKQMQLQYNLGCSWFRIGYIFLCYTVSIQTRLYFTTHIIPHPKDENTFKSFEVLGKGIGNCLQLP
jgi:hypothetical protein